MRFILIACLLIGSGALSAQEKTTFTADSIDNQFGITRYRMYNPFIGKGQQRQKADGLPCEGYVTDLYADGNMLHKGFYTDGRLRLYKNFFPNGNVERDFKLIDDHKCTLKTYHANGKLRTKTKFVDANPIEYEEYYANGNLEFYEKYDNRYEYYLEQRSYQENGDLVFSLELEKKSKKLYQKKEYHENGKVKAEGPMHFNEVIGAYHKIDWWTVYSESGKALRQEEYSNNKIVTTKEL